MRISRNLKGFGKKVAQFFMNHFVWFKPLFSWIGPRTRSRIKTVVMRWAFKRLYGKPSSSEGRERIESSSPELEITLPFQSSPSYLKGVNLIGLPRAIIGEGEFVRQTAKSFQSTSLDFGIYDARSNSSSKPEKDQSFDHIRSDNPFNINIFHLKPDQLESSVVTLGRSFVENRYNIGYWVWELGEFPSAWQAPLDFLDEVWCPSRFIQAAVMKKSSKPVLYLPLSIELEISQSFDRNYFSLPPRSFIFLFVFDFKSFATRKNPSSCIRAFLKAFPKGDEAVSLVIKSMDGSLYPQEFDRLAQEAKKDPRIILIDASYQSDEIIGLMQTCDCFISLHRSEGIGLGLAQSMLLGKPVIATNYSGNTDFTLEGNSCLVKYDLIPVGKNEYPFAKGQVWADPDVEHAAWYMKRLVEDEDYRESIAAKGQSTIRDNHNCAVIGKGYVDRLKTLGLV
jgi:glycosyltransferase involved in cell wall biosynthesis